MKFLFCLLLLSCLNFSGKAQAGMTISAQSIITDSTGKHYTLVEASELLKTKLYTIEQVGSKDQSPSKFLLKKGSGIWQKTSFFPAEFEGTGSIKAILNNMPAPAFAASTFEGKKVDLNKLRNKIVVLNFWFTGCKPCIKEMPELNTLIESYKKEEDVIFLAPTFNNPAEIKKFLQSTSFKYQIVPEQKDGMIADYQVDSYPSHVIIDYNGISRFATAGFLDGENRMYTVLKYKIDKLLEEKQHSGEIIKIADALQSGLLQKDYQFIKGYMDAYFPIKQPSGDMVTGAFIDDVLTQYFKNKIKLSEVKLKSFHFIQYGYKMNFSSVDSVGKVKNFHVLLNSNRKITEISLLKDEVHPIQIKSRPSPKANISITGPTKRVASLPFIFKQNMIVIKIKINGSNEFVEFIFDTGSSIPFLTKATQERLGLQLTEGESRIDGGGGKLATSRSENNRIILNDSLWLDQVSFAITDMTAISTGFTYDGIIGAELMKNFIVHIDFEHQRLELFTSSNFSAPTGWQTLPIVKMIGDIPVIETDLGIGQKTRKMNLLFDCGAAPFSLFLNKKNFDEFLPLFASKSYMEEILTGLGGSMRVRTYRTDAIWNGRQWPDLPIGFDKEASTPLLEKVDGILGMEFIRRYNVIFNYAKNEIYFQPNQSIDSPFPVSYSGLQLTTRNQKIIIAHVSPDSPGALAGLQAADEIISFDGHAMQKTEKAKTFLQEPGRSVLITVKREETLLTFTVVLKRFY